MGTILHSKRKAGTFRVPKNHLNKFFTRCISSGGELIDQSELKSKTESDLEDLSLFKAGATVCVFPLSMSCSNVSSILEFIDW